MSEPLRHKVRSAYAWTFAGTLLRQALSFGISILLARFLTPGDYGLAGIVAIFVAILSAVQDAGLGQAAIYFGDEADYATLCTISTGAGLVSCALLNAAAGGLAAVYHSPQLVPVVRWMSLVLILGGLRSVSQALVIKDLHLKKLTAIESISGLVAASVAVVLAWRGFGVWSIVANALLSNLFSTILMLFAIPPRYTLRPKADVVRKVVRWGLPLTGSSLLWNFYDNSDDMIVGHMANAQQLGFYTLGFRMATLINERIGAVMSRVSFPTFAAMRENRAELVNHWLSVTRKTALLTFPALVMLATTAHDFVAATLGAKWLPAVPVLRILCVAAGIRGLTPIIVNLLPALGKPGLAFRYTLLNATVMPIGFAIGCRFGGIDGVALAWFVCFPVLAAGLVHTALSLTETRWIEFLANLRVPLLSAATVFLAMLPPMVFAKPGVLRLIGSCLTGGLAFAVWTCWDLNLHERFHLNRKWRSALMPAIDPAR